MNEITRDNAEGDEIARLAPPYEVALRVGKTCAVSVYLETHYAWIGAVGIVNHIFDEKKPVANWATGCPAGIKES